MEANRQKKLDRLPQGVSWVQRLKRVFAIEIEKCEKCGGKMKVIDEMSHQCIEEPEIVDKILKHLRLDRANSLRNSQHNRSPPGDVLASTTTLF